MSQRSQGGEGPARSPTGDPVDPPTPTEPPEPPPPPPPPAPSNALGLTPQEVVDVRRVHGLLARDASTHCVRMHTKYFRRYPSHLERFCGRKALAEPLHYAPAELSRDSEFTARSLMHGLAQLQALRCSCSCDADLLTSQLAGIARAHRGLGLTRDDLRRYRDVMLGYLDDALPQAMTPTVKQSWSAFLSTLTEALADSLEQQEQRGRIAPSDRRRMAFTSSWVEWDTIHEGRVWRNDSDTFPLLLEDDEMESFTESDDGERSECPSETFPVGMSASHFIPD